MYHYTACGLDNVWLENGYVEHMTAYGRGVSIVAAEELHRLLASKLVAKPARLTGKELRFLRVQMGLSQSGLAKLQGVTEQAVSLWERHGKVPKANDLLVRICYMGQIQGDTKLKTAIDQIKTVERLVHQRIVARASGSKWSSKVETTDSSATASGVPA